MNIKTFTKKLELKKKTIANLDNVEIKSLHGGGPGVNKTLRPTIPACPLFLFFWFVGGEYKIGPDNTEVYHGKQSLRFTSIKGANAALPGFASARLPVPRSGENVSGSPGY